MRIAALFIVVALAACSAPPESTFTPSTLQSTSARISAQSIPTAPVQRVFTAGRTPGFPSTAVATDITAGPQNSMWFVDPGTPAIGTISQSGTVTEYTKGLQRRSWLISIVAAPDGTMWFSDAFGYIGRVDQTGTITEFSINAFSKTQSPLGIAVDAQGAVWTLARGPFESQLIRSDSQGHLTAVALPHGELADGTLA